MQDAKKKLVQEVAKDCKTVEDVHNLLKDMFKRTIQLATDCVPFVPYIE